MTCCPEDKFIYYSNTCCESGKRAEQFTSVITSYDPPHYSCCAEGEVYRERTMAEGCCVSTNEQKMYVVPATKTVTDRIDGECCCPSPSDTCVWMGGTGGYCCTKLNPNECQEIETVSMNCDVLVNKPAGSSCTTKEGITGTCDGNGSCRI